MDHRFTLGVLKRDPEDFLVREVAVPQTVSRDLATHRYLVMRKYGLSTPAAAAYLAQFLEIPPHAVTYSGRKDEEGITEQLIAIPASVDATPIMERPLLVGAGSWLTIHHHGFGSEPLAVGELVGNSFSITVRGLGESTAAYLSEQRRVNLFFLNYYDTQRFGVPEGPKRTHKVGQALLAGDFAVALDEVSGLRSAESEAARSWTADPAMFFSELDDRVVAFYLSAAESARWNAVLADEVRQAASPHVMTLSVESLSYLFVTMPAGPIAVLAAAHELPYARYDWSGGEAVPRETRRPTVVQTLVTVKEMRRSGPEWNASLDFFLPSGCYATMAVRQLIVFTGRFETENGPVRLETAW